MTRLPCERIVILGPPGSGKGTQGLMLAEAMEHKHIASGDLMRQHLAKKTGLGLKSKRYYSKGLLAPDDIIISMVLPDVMAACQGFILDGFPRNVSQAKRLDQALSEAATQIDRALLIAVPKEETLMRLADRRVCGQCGRVYHVTTAPSRVDGECDECGGRLCQREDDKLEAIDTRMEEYRSLTKPLADFYRGQGKLTEIDGVGSSDEIQERILRALGRVGVKEGSAG